MIESSYENVDPTQLKDLRAELYDEVVAELAIHPLTKFRRVPVAAALDLQRDAIGECSAKSGHTLRVDGKGKRIYCTTCPAEWKYEGF